MDTHVKERLTGAIILVGVLVFLVPELLTGPKREPAPAPTAADEPPLRSYTIDLKDDARGNPTAGSPVPNEVTTPAPQPMGATPSDSQSPERVESSEGAGDASIADDRSATADASALADTSTAAESAEDPEPPAPRADANTRTASSGSAPADSRPNTDSRTPSAVSRDSPKPASGGGWSIQVGSFSSRANAERLASELKGKGFAATVSEGKGGGKRGKKLFRVRVGPEPDKAAAKELNTRLRAVGRAGSLVAE